MTCQSKTTTLSRRDFNRSLATLAAGAMAGGTATAASKPLGKVRFGKTDLLVTVDDVSVGVSVTRAYHYPPEEGYTEQEAADLLESKLDDVLASAANAQDPWTRSMLHVIAYDEEHALSVQLAYQELDESLTQSTLVFLTITDGEDSEVY